VVPGSNVHSVRPLVKGRMVPNTGDRPGVQKQLCARRDPDAPPPGRGGGQVVVPLADWLQGRPRRVAQSAALFQRRTPVGVDGPAVAEPPTMSEELLNV